jgi:hypothetical protein
MAVIHISVYLRVSAVYNNVEDFYKAKKLKPFHPRMRPWRIPGLAV